MISLTWINQRGGLWRSAFSARFQDHAGITSLADGPKMTLCMN